MGKSRGEFLDELVELSPKARRAKLIALRMSDAQGLLWILRKKPEWAELLADEEPVAVDERKAAKSASAPAHSSGAARAPRRSSPSRPASQSAVRARSEERPRPAARDSSPSRSVGSKRARPAATEPEEFKLDPPEDGEDAPAPAPGKPKPAPVAPKELRRVSERRNIWPVIGVAGALIALVVTAITIIT